MSLEIVNADNLEDYVELPARQKIMKRKPSGKFKMHEFQKEDLARLIEQDGSANFSEMGLSVL